MATFNIIAFYIFSALALMFTFLTIVARRTIYSVVSGVVVFLSVASLYFLLNSPFNAVAQIAIYGIGVTLLLIFAVMLINPKTDAQVYIALKLRTVFAVFGVALIAFSVYLLLYDDFHEFLVNFEYLGNTKMYNMIETTASMGVGMFTHYLLAFELLSVFLLAALIGVGVVFIKFGNEDK